jgi:hypothetical protein
MLASNFEIGWPSDIHSAADRQQGAQTRTMAFSINMSAAARRHLMAAEELAAGRRRDVAGYLYGIAAECAIKAMMVDAGLRPSPDPSRRHDPFFAHFPELRTMLRDALKGRRGTPLISYIQNDAFMNNWSTRMRYSDGKDILPRWIDAWAEQARQAVASIGT